MQLTCPHDHFLHEGAVTKYGTEWQATCPRCGRTFPVDLPQASKPIIMAFVDDRDPSKDEAHFRDNWLGEDIRTLYGFDTPEEFMAAWRKMVEHPDGMWYFVLNDQKLVCAGACDPGDLEGFIDEFGLPAEKYAIPGDADCED